MKVPSRLRQRHLSRLGSPCQNVVGKIADIINKSSHHLHTLVPKWLISRSIIAHVLHGHVASSIRMTLLSKRWAWHPLVCVWSLLHLDPLVITPSGDTAYADQPEYAGGQRESSCQPCCCIHASSESTVDAISLEPTVEVAG